MQDGKIGGSQRGVLTSQNEVINQSMPPQPLFHGTACGILTPVLQPMAQPPPHGNPRGIDAIWGLLLLETL